MPIRLGLVNSAGTRDRVVRVLGKHKRYEVANYPNVTIPTNLDVAENARGQFGAFYAALFDRTVAKTPRPVVTEYAWDAGSCDPCPSPPLTVAELVTLGADPGPKPSRPFSPRRTYSGGREVRGEGGALESGATTEGGTNTFQERYAVRHPWAGLVACAAPVRNEWSGPSSGLDNGGVKAALGPAYAPFSPPSPAPPVIAHGPLEDAGAEASATKTSGCLGCAITPASDGTARVALGLVGLAGPAAFTRRRRRDTPRQGER